MRFAEEAVAFRLGVKRLVVNIRRVVVAEDGPAAGKRMKQIVRLPRRSTTYGVGKEIGGAVYVHRDYESVLGDAVAKARRHLPDGFDYDVVKLNRRNGHVSFVQVADFDTAPEPAVVDSILVRQDGSTRYQRQPEDPYVYHHKWLFVADDYRGFDVRESMARSRSWMQLADVDRSRIGKKSYWEAKVVPRMQSRE